MFADSLTWFDQISLAELNESMTLLERKEQKFIVHFWQLDWIIWSMKDQFRLLTIWNTDMFSYENVYMDTSEYALYHAHNSWSKKRLKIRTRKYVDSDLHFFEYKQKANKRVTKFRYSTPASEFWQMSKQAQEFCNGVDSEYTLMPYELLTPSLQNSYQRVTLCSVDACERVTIDYNIAFTDPRTWKSARIDNIAIIETKSISQPSPCSSVLASKYWISPQSACSKYCMWLYMTNAVEDASRFKNTLNHIAWLQAEYATHQLIASVHHSSSDTTSTSRQPSWQQAV